MPATPTPSPLEGRFTRTLNRVLVKLKVDEVPHIKRIIVTVVGGTVLIFGVALIVTPGPAVLVMPVGLAILGTEYAWARRWLRKARKLANKALSRTQKIIGAATSSAGSKASSKRKPVAAPGTMDSTAAAKTMPDAERGDARTKEMAGLTQTRGDASPFSG